ncbi:MAG: hypothetical protein IB616_02935 [Methanosarcinales archaeon]|nr:MAG: hypothetical protein IB616_02935 [Methanosarcinales archaeon]
MKKPMKVGLAGSVLGGLITFSMMWFASVDFESILVLPWTITFLICGSITVGLLGYSLVTEAELRRKMHFNEFFKEKRHQYFAYCLVAGTVMFSFSNLFPVELTMSEMMLVHLYMVLMVSWAVASMGLSFMYVLSKQKRG